MSLTPDQAPSDHRPRAGLLLALALSPSLAAAAPPRVCLVTDKALPTAACRGVSPQPLGPDRPATVELTIPITGLPPTVELTVIDAAHPTGRRLSLAPIVRDPNVAERRFLKVADRARYRLLSGEHAGNYRPLWHPDGRYLVWHQIGDHPRLWCADAHSPTAEPVPIEFPNPDADELFDDVADGISHFEWIPGTTQLVVRLTRARKLRRVDLEGCRGETTIAEDLPEATEFALSPDGNWMVWRPTDAERLLIGPVGGRPIGELCGPTADPLLRTSVCRGLRWNPDGREVAFWHARAGQSGGQRIVLVAIDRRRRVIGRPRQLDVSGPAASTPRKKSPAMAIAYSPSGRHLGFVSDGRIHIADTHRTDAQPTDAQPTDAKPARSQARELSVARGRYNSNKSDIVWLDTHHIAAVVDGSGGQHPVVVAHTDPETPPTILSRAFPSHYDLAWDAVGRRLAVSSFAGQQSIFVADIASTDPQGAAAAYFLTVRQPGLPPVHLSGDRPQYHDRHGLVLAGQWDLSPDRHTARLALTFTLRSDP